jgi:DNA-binding response OmpR family regulator
VEISEALSFFCGARKDIECEVINAGQEGLDRIRAENFDLILLDLADTIQTPCLSYSSSSRSNTLVITYS